MFKVSNSRIKHFLKHKLNASNLTIPDFLTQEFWGEALVAKSDLQELLLEVTICFAKLTWQQTNKQHGKLQPTITVNQPTNQPPNLQINAPKKNSTEF